MAVVCAGIAVTGTLSSCKVLPRADSSSDVSSSAVGQDLAPLSGSTAPCPFSAAPLAPALVERWPVASVPSGGCHYTQRARTILVSAVPAPKDAKGRRAALAQVRKPCASGSAQALPAGPGAFVCRQDNLVEAVTIVGGRLLVVCSTAGPDPAELSSVRAALSALVARAV